MAGTARHASVRRSPIPPGCALSPSRQGWTSSGSTRSSCPFDYADEEELLGPLFDSALGRAVGRRAAPVALREAVLERLAPYRTAAGGYRLENVFRVLVARRT